MLIAVNKQQPTLRKSINFFTSTRSYAEMASNQAAFLDAPSTPLRVGSTPMPKPGPDDVVIKNHAVSINPLDLGMAASGRFCKTLPWVLGQDVAGEIHDIGSSVTHLRKGDRVVGHSWSLFTGQTQDGAWSLYSNVPAKNTAIIPQTLPFTEAVVLPLAIDTATSGLFDEQKPGLALEWPDAHAEKSAVKGVVVVYGASSSVGSMAIQLATAAGYRVIGIASKRNFDFCRSCGATDVFDYKDSSVVDGVIKAVGDDTFIGVYDAIGTAASSEIDVAILEKLGGGSLATVHDVPANLPANVKAKHIFGLGAFSFPIWEKFVTPALESGKLQCLPKPLVVGKGLESLQKAMDRLKDGVSAQKIVVEL
ncbi:Hypothetical protein R9X50_00474700 [Acrodontium crateriforme]|uniref:Enoyl reductase (ER) domain-containing protein n=1 Tax=Acrodontium crateriforme TaxID=150365 RepID=A0AAQ3M643_9PEZI|nr:Hypothetical protein R9X50_00474700 [Acrodontium crateriforme]